MDMSVQGSFLTRKLGPLPTWAWMLIGLGVAITVSVIRANKQASAKKNPDESSGSTDGSGVDLIGGDQEPPIVFQNYNTSIFTPPAGGRESPPVAPPPAGPPAKPPPPAPVTTGRPPPVTSGHGQWVTVSKWTAKNAPWNSTLWGIANHLYHNGGRWPAIWNAPQNKALKTRRKKPEEIRAGDKIWVPAN